jgi:hypothetical protein
MGDYEDTVRILEVELGQVEGAFRGLAEEDWRAPTKLRPLDETKTPQEMPDKLRDTFAKTVDGARSMAPDTVGPGYYALMRLDEFVASRVVEAVVHGLDLTDALGRQPMATPEGLAVTATILDELLARRTVAGRPPDLAGDDLAWVRAASGRGPAHPDPRLPLIG